MKEQDDPYVYPVGHREIKNLSDGINGSHEIAVKYKIIVSALLLITDIVYYHSSFTDSKRNAVLKNILIITNIEEKIHQV